MRFREALRLVPVAVLLVSAPAYARAQSGSGGALDTIPSAVTISCTLTHTDLPSAGAASDKYNFTLAVTRSDKAAAKYSVTLDQTGAGVYVAVAGMGTSKPIMLATSAAGGVIETKGVAPPSAAQVAAGKALSKNLVTRCVPPVR